MKVLSEILMSVWLFVCGWQDFKEKKISIALLAAGSILLISFSIAGGLPAISRLLGVAIGLVLLALSKLLKGQIGPGDGIIVCITGFCLGFHDNLNLLFYGLTISALLSLSLLLLRKAGGKDSIPFVPFLFLSYLGGVFWL